MRAKTAFVAFVVFGLLGAVGFTASAAERVQTAPQVLDRGHGSGNGHDHGNGNGDEGKCIAEDKALIGPVCVKVEDVISNILTN
jgi:hypothetical protein